MLCKDVDDRTRAAIEVLASESEPLELDSLAADADGLLCRSRAAKVLSFHFRFAGIAFDAMAAKADGLTRLLVSAPVGPVPYTVESPTARRFLLDTLRRPQRDGFGRLVMDHQGKVRLEAVLETDRSLCPAVLVGMAGMFAHRAFPVLSLLTEMASPRPG
ncbi:MAG: hypothetical protein QNJ92_15405 [Alphaproteobacteria bacterium]|nr:hypothetical protein [Alphaproteobacteria bacterium]